MRWLIYWLRGLLFDDTYQVLPFSRPDYTHSIRLWQKSMAHKGGLK